MCGVTSPLMSLVSTVRISLSSQPPSPPPSATDTPQCEIHRTSRESKNMI